MGRRTVTSVWQNVRTKKSVVMVNVHVNNKNHGVDVHERENKCVERTAKLTTINVWRNAEK